MRRLGNLADRLLARFVPEVEAAAACTPGQFWGFCYCASNGAYYCKNCQLLASCDDRCASTYTKIGTC
ncbi:hypothetical protein [Actinoplanes derwentensis]|uniref:Uncharacterized protein n=1 Tax=Actinoplanes derwentensis TaxID=113562 RepID=A0A1H1VT11_9ACTN|nr:hypothetical protein [Actinoplanes derwentensis]GID83588.1 hypothetical protein Ade03nite_25120 [Actinoplanes derwentensis]SDS88074.1 hypothetical protein SAMN04489716_1873 [Actinoplanes derwentensis]